MTTKDLATAVAACTASAGVVVHQLGGWDGLLVTLVCIMAVDVVLGMFLAILGLSEKTASGRFRSSAMLQGMFKKGTLLGLIFIGHRLDLSVGGGSHDLIADGITVFAVVYELSSVLESTQKLGLPLPKALVDALEFLRKKYNAAETAKGGNDGKE